MPDFEYNKRTMCKYVCVGNTFGSLVRIKIKLFVCGKLDWVKEDKAINLRFKTWIKVEQTLTKCLIQLCKV